MKYGALLGAGAGPLLLLPPPQETSKPKDIKIMQLQNCFMIIKDYLSMT